MKTLRRSKYVLIVLCSIGLFGVYYWLQNKVEPVIMESEIEKEVLTENSQMDIPREHTNYITEIKFNGDCFKGIQTINYVHEFNKTVDQVLLKLYTNTPKVDREQVYLTKVLINGENVSFKQNSSNAWIQLTRPLQSGETISIGIQFEGVLNKSDKGAVYTQNIIPQIAVFDEVNGWAEQNYSMEEKSYLEVANYKITLIVPEKIVPICTGNLIEKYEPEEGMIKYTFDAKKVRGIGIYLNTLRKEYHFETEDGTTIQVYFNGLIDEEILKVRLQEVFKYYANILGRYPYEKFTMIDVPQKEVPIVYPQIALIDLKKINTDYEMLYYGVGKQWIPYIIGHEPQKDMCLNIGLEAYLAKRRTNSMETMKKYLKENTYSEDKKAKKQYEESLYLEAYIKPMKLFLQIEDTIGTEAWEEFLREYYKKKSFELSSYSEFVEMLLQYNKGNSQWLLDEYSHIITDRKGEVR